MNAIEKAKVLIGADDDKEEIIIALYEMAHQEFLDYCNRNDVPNSAQNVIANMIMLAYNRLGAEGLSSQNYSNVSEAYIDGYPDNIKNN